jgi:two-component system cell cycle sensor histidine kinase/response regulator CckA
MTGKDDKPTEIAKLRSRAEEIAQQQVDQSEKELKALSREEALRLVHELRVHEIELTMQNDELCRAQAELDATRERYFDLYNLAPVGYFIVSHEGRVLETNLTGANLLGVPRAALVKQPITRFIFREDQDVYYLHRRELLATGQANTCELRMVKPDGTAFWVRLTATKQDPPASGPGRGTGGAPVTRVVLSDISAQKQLEQDKVELGAQLQQAKKRSRAGTKPGIGKNGKNNRAKVKGSQ